MHIADTLETEVNLSRALRARANERRKMGRKERWGAEEGVDEEEDGGEEVVGSSLMQAPIAAPASGAVVGDPASSPPPAAKAPGASVDGWAYTATHLQRFLDELKGGMPGDSSLKGKGRVRPKQVEKRCKEILLAEGFVSNNENAGDGDDAGGGSGGRGGKQRAQWSSSSSSKNDFVEWSPIDKVKLGAALIRLLLDHTSFSPPGKNERGGDGRPPPEPAFRYLRKRVGERKYQAHVAIHPGLLDVAVGEGYADAASVLHMSMASGTRVQPMVVPPKDWTGVREGGYETIRVPFMRTRHCKTQKVR
mmetsp:Transcript_5667/g.8595  ORF Transcript_5667/g.8595 Transcript_5667/m.8595 type:complete len:306 (+) Transcript_5667:1859-2776(+)